MVGSATRSVALTSTAADLLPTTYVGTKTIPANFLVVGKTLRITVRGYVTTAPAATGTPTVLLAEVVTAMRFNPRAAGIARAEQQRAPRLSGIRRVIDMPPRMAEKHVPKRHTPQLPVQRARGHGCSSSGGMVMMYS